MMNYRNESSVTTYAGHLVDATLGTPGSVEFDFGRIWNFIKQRRRSGMFRWSPLEFIHVHPPGFGTQYSMTDLNCVEGFVQAFGLDANDPFRFSIVTFDNNDPLDYTVKKTFYMPVKVDGVVSLERSAEYLGYSNPADYTLALLKIMSYRGVNPEE